MQKNLTSESDFDSIKSACADNGLDFLSVYVIPFSDSLPEFEIHPCSIYYGSTTFNRLIYDNPDTRKGIFFDPHRFAMRSCLSEWGNHMLNADAVITKIGGLDIKAFNPDQVVFVRPDSDDKPFAGAVMKFSDLYSWVKSLAAVQDSLITESTEILIAVPKLIDMEWRLWLVNGRVVASTKYREKFNLALATGCPAEVAEFAEAMAAKYEPDAVFVMDVCSWQDQYYVLECGCMNGAGFYASDIGSIIKSVSDFFFARNCQEYTTKPFK